MYPFSLALNDVNIGSDVFLWLIVSIVAEGKHTVHLQESIGTKLMTLIPFPPRGFAAVTIISRILQEKPDEREEAPDERRLAD